MAYPNATLPQGSLVLVSGVTGLCGAAIARELLRAGYKVRGATRTATKAEPLKKIFDDQYGSGNFEIVQVKDVHAAGAFDEAMRGTAGVVHVASDLSFGADPDVVVKGTVEFTLNVMRSAAKTPTIKRVVLTSSGVAAVSPEAGVPVEIKDMWMWNDATAKLAYTLPADHPKKPSAVYAASKVEGEKAAWKFMEEEKPNFKFNTVLPVFVAGEIVNPGDGGSTAGMVKNGLVNRDFSILLSIMNPTMPYVGVADVARIHLGALVDVDITGERLWASAGNFTIPQMLDIFRKRYGSDKIMKDEELPEIGSTDVRIEQPHSLEILKKLGRDGYQSFEEVMDENIKGVAL